jgi:hypothetical protein
MGTGDTGGAGPRPATGLQGAVSLDALTAQPGNSSSSVELRQTSVDRYKAYSEEEGLALLAHCSPDSGDEDTNLVGDSTELLDYDSDNASEPPTDAAHRIPGNTVSTVDQCEMDTDIGGASRLLNKNVISNGTNISDDAVYHQCRTALVTSFKDTLVSVSKDETFGKTISIQTPLVGSLGDHPNACGTFHGSCVMKGNTCVNQSISASFDPAKLTCISCKKEHSIDGKNPGVFFFTDQNFVPAISNNNEMCVNIVRIENA